MQQSGNNTNNAVHITHAFVRRNDNYILSDVSLDIRSGEHVAIIGPNGAGKSTLVSLISMDIHPLARDDFHRVIFGQERWPVMELKKHLGIVSPLLAFFCNTTYTAFDIILSGLFSAIGLDFHHQVTDEMRERTRKEMEKVGIWHLRDKYMNTLSSGETQKVLLARAAIHNPEMLLLDEAAAALDFPARASLRETISGYAKEGKTIVMVTHEMAEIIPEIQRIILLKGGRIIADGPKEEILTEKLLSSIYGTTVYVDHRNGLYNAWC